MAKSKTQLSDEDKVKTYLVELKHSLREEFFVLRDLIVNAFPNLNERIKWNAPSYYASVDLFTFNLSNENLVRLVFHHPAIVQIKSPLLLGDFPDRRIMVFNGLNEVHADSAELKRVIAALLNLITSP